MSSIVLRPGERLDIPRFELRGKPLAVLCGDAPKTSYPFDPRLSPYAIPYNSMIVIAPTTTSDRLLVTCLPKEPTDVVQK